MPWQMVPGLLIIGGAFALTGFGLTAVDKLAYGKHKRNGMDEFIFKLDARDVLLKQKALKAAKEAKTLADTSPPEKKE